MLTTINSCWIAVGMKESYVNMQLVLDSIDYNGHQWVICGDLKVIAILLGMQLGYTKFCCFLCEWDSRARSEHYKKSMALTEVSGSRN